MPQPSPEQLAVIAADLDITLEPARLRQAHALHAASRADLERLRAITLPFVGDVTEPAAGDVWLASGGRS